MKVRYEFINGDVSEVEVSAEWSNVLFAMDDAEAKNDRKNSRLDRHTPLSAFDYEGALFDAGVDVAGEALHRMDAAELHRAMELLLPRQRELVFKVHFMGRTLVSIADEEGVTEAAIRNRLKKIYANLKKVLL